MKLVAISGSLRSGSSNAALIRAAMSVAPAGVEWDVYEQLGELPHFSPDLDAEPIPEAVARLRALLASADAILISTPEYAHGVPGSLKNALDWIVSSGEFRGKPVGIFIASAGGEHARASLTHTLEVMEARVIAAAGLGVPNARKRLGADGSLLDPMLREELKRAIDSLIAAAR